MLKMVIGVYDILWERDMRRRRIEDLLTSWSLTTPFTATGMPDSFSWVLLLVLECEYVAHISSTDV
jgi:hypothetical protein